MYARLHKEPKSSETADEYSSKQHLGKSIACSTMDASIACKKMRKSTVIYCFAVSTYLWVYCPMLHGQK